MVSRPTGNILRNGLIHHLSIIFDGGPDASGRCEKIAAALFARVARKSLSGLLPQAEAEGFFVGCLHDAARNYAAVVKRGTACSGKLIPLALAELQSSVRSATQPLISHVWSIWMGCCISQRSATQAAAGTELS